ncbi:MAG: hypothetical protein K6E87_02205 [bacterium]|nr:hypothetical protein [bacterium]
MRKIYKLKDYHWNKDAEGTKRFHLVIVSAYNKRSKNCWVRTITSLDKFNKKTNKYEFVNDKIDEVRSGEIIVVPNKDVNSDILTGIYRRPIKVKFRNLEATDKKLIYPKKYHNIIKK